MEKIKNFLGRATLLPISTPSTPSTSCLPGNKMLASGYASVLLKKRTMIWVLTPSTPAVPNCYCSKEFSVILV